MATNDSGLGVSFDDLETASVDADDADTQWLDLESGDEIIGELVAVNTDCGEYDSRVYELKDEIGAPHKLIWGKASIDAQIDDLAIESGDVIGIRNTGVEFETDNGAGVEFEVGVVR